MKRDIRTYADICGYSKCSEALEFHHQEKTTKDFGISMKGYTRCWLRVKIVIENFMRKQQLSRVIGIEKSGEFREA